MTALLLCADPLAPARSRRPDPHFAREAEAAAEAGGDTAVIDHDALVRGDADEAVRRVPRDLGPAWYRGWMLTGQRYAALEAALAERGCRLSTDADAFRRAHELPGWYEVFRERTPASVWTAEPTDAWLAGAASALGSTGAVVKDFVKSRKHEWASACHVPDLADAPALRRVVDAFTALQGEDLYGGVVLRAFEDFAGGEARVWWLDGEPAAVTAHPDTPGEAVAPDLSGLREPVAALGCRFVTTDLVRRADGAWRVVEVGDGQVSDLPADADVRPLIAALVER